MKRAIVTCVLDLSVEKGYAPSVQEITTACNLRSKATTQRYINQLITEGRLERDVKRFRTLRVVM